MPRNYIINKKTGAAFGHSVRAFPKGLKIIHIGNDVWRIGKVSNVPKKENQSIFGKHQVIYGPDNKEYHLGQEEIMFCAGGWLYPSEAERYDPYYYQEWGFSRDDNPADHAAFKIYVLTSILDKRENWCFDLKCTPAIGPLKVIYNNGTVKNIDFNGAFEDIIIKKKYSIYSTNYIEKKIKPVGYRILNSN
jgi:hypothetical protein